MNSQKHEGKVNPRKRYSFQQRNVRSELSVKEGNKIPSKHQASTTMVGENSAQNGQNEQYEKMLSQLSLLQKKNHNQRTNVKQRTYQTKYIRYKSSISTHKEKTVTQSISVEEECFYGKVRQNQEKFLEHCRNQKFDKAGEILINLLNYIIDIQNLKIFFKFLKAICAFYILAEQPEIAFKFYKQLQQAALLQSKYQYVTYSLIGMANCCDDDHLYDEGISILKKALEYAWISWKRQLELNVYDEIGKKYYKMGFIEKANAYHQKFSDSLEEPSNSPLRLLSIQKIQAKQAKNCPQKYDKLNLLYLVHLFIPIKDTSQLPLLKGIPQKETIRDEIRVKSQQPKPSSSYIDSIQYQVKKVLQGWMFEDEIEELETVTEKQVKDKRKNKNKFLDFKLNQHLRMMGIKPIKKDNFLKEKSQKKVKYKESLQKQIDRLIKEPSLSEDWYQKMVKEVSNDQKRKVNHVNSPIRLSKKKLSIHSRSECEKFQSFYRKLYFYK